MFNSQEEIKLEIILQAVNKSMIDQFKQNEKHTKLCSLHLKPSFSQYLQECINICINSQIDLKKHSLKLKEWLNFDSIFRKMSDHKDKQSSIPSNSNNFSEAGDTFKMGNYPGDLSNVGLNSDSDEDDGINNYHSMLRETFSQDARSQASYFDPLQDPSNYAEDGFDFDKQSVKSHFSSASAKSFHSDGSIKSVQTLRTEQQSGTGTNESKDYNRQKRKYMKQEARRIKQELKQEEMKMKKEKKQYKDLDIDPDGRRGLKGLKSKRKRLTKKTLELLAKKFDEFYAYQSNCDFRGPRMSIRQIGQLFNMGNSAIHKLYTEWMQDPNFYERIHRDNLKKSLPERKITLERLEHVARLIKQNPFLTQNELTVQLNKIDDLKFVKDGQLVEITRTTVARLLKVGKFKKKRVKCVPKERNTTKSLQKRYEYCSKYKQLLERKAKVYFLDESGFNLYMTRDKAWARPNQEITVNCPISKGKRFSLIAIIAEDGLTHWRIIEGTYRKYEYLDFIRQLFARLKEQEDELTEQERNSEDNKRDKWLVLDNCAIHDKQQTVSLGKQCGMQILYLPPYSPQLNPIQNWFNEVKAIIRKTNYSGQKQLLEIMHRTLKSFENYDFSNYYSGIRKHVEMGIKKNKF